MLKEDEMTELSTKEIYFNDLGNYGLLSKSEVLELAEKSKCGDISARNKIITSNLKLVVKIAKYYSQKYKASLEDLISSGNIGLVIAAQKFDPSFGVCFTTYAQFWICDEIRKFLNGNHDIVLPKKRAAELSKKINTYAESIDDENFYERNISSDFSVEEEVERKIAAEAVRNFIQTLPVNEKNIISMHYGIGTEKRTMEEIGKFFMKDKQWAFRKIRKVLDNAQRCSKYKYLNFCC